MNLQGKQLQYGHEFLRLVSELYNPSKMSSNGILSLKINVRPILNRIPEYHHFEEQ